MAAGVERVVRRCMDGEKFLGSARGSQAPHLSFSWSDRNVGAFNPIVVPLGSMMPRRETEFTSGGSVGSQLVRDQCTRCKALSLHELPHQLQGRAFIPAWLGPGHPAPRRSDRLRATDTSAVRRSRHTSPRDAIEGAPWEVSFSAAWHRLDRTMPPSVVSSRKKPRCLVPQAGPLHPRS